jgi:acyl dehydratase
MPGLYFENFQIGMRFNHAMRRTVTETDNLMICTLTHNPQPLHLDAEYAVASEFGQIVVNGIFTFGLMIGLSVADTTLGTLVANLGYDAVTMPNPVFIGDTLRSQTMVIDLRPSRSRPHAGLVVFEHQAFNQRDDLVCQCRRTALLQRKS